MATGGDQIELNPPKIPEINPTKICQKYPSPIFNLMPNKIFAEKTTIAKPIAKVNKDVGYEVMKIEVIKILKIIVNEKKRNSKAVFKRSSDLKNWAKFVKISGIIIIEIASIGPITSVNKAMAADGNPIPKNPFIIPDKINVTIIKMIIYGSLNGMSASSNLISRL